MASEVAQVVEEPTEIAVPGVGTLVHLDDAGECAQALKDVRGLEQVLRTVKATLTEALVRESEKRGTKTMHVSAGDWEATVAINHPTEIVWDEEILEGLMDIGLPEDRYNELVVETVSYKVSAVVAKQLAGANPKYAEIIDRARTDVERPRTASVK